MIETFNVIAAVLTIGIGLFGLISPNYIASVLDLAPTSSTMGYSELRASTGGLYVLTGAAALWYEEPLAFAMLGFVYAGAAMGRFISLAFDNPPLRKVLAFGGIETVLALWFLCANLPYI
ncbi:DUF4345 family protein [Albibacillus kandeliae]|uniref:DUF4345 family protein n=1 Tax=Albibacillus kandeliae TaxID=2174228 RepID=UPI000D6971F5|nr:DUF4345 family protein [Albibacillus kandeliae]